MLKTLLTTTPALTLAVEAGIVGTGPFRGESYDAAALIALAMQSAGFAERADLAAHLASVANALGTPIGVGVSNVEFDEVGDAAGTYREIEVDGLSFQTRNV